jgi:hypothetical protein
MKNRLIYETEHHENFISFTSRKGEKKITHNVRKQLTSTRVKSDAVSVFYAKKSCNNLFNK